MFSGRFSVTADCARYADQRNEQQRGNARDEASSEAYRAQQADYRWLAFDVSRLLLLSVIAGASLVKRNSSSYSQLMDEEGSPMRVQFAALTCILAL